MLVEKLIMFGKDTDKTTSELKALIAAKIRSIGSVVGHTELTEAIEALIDYKVSNAIDELISYVDKTGINDPDW